MTATPPLKVCAVAIWILVQRLLTFSVVRCAKMSEIYKGLKTLPGGLHLERCSKECENCGVQIKVCARLYLQPGDTDTFFPSPEKLLLPESVYWKAKLKPSSTIKATEHR